MIHATESVVELRKAQEKTGKHDLAKCLELEVAAREPLRPIVEKFGRGATVALVYSLAETSQRLYIERQLLHIASENAAGGPQLLASDGTSRSWLG